MALAWRPLFLEGSAGPEAPGGPWKLLEAPGGPEPVCGGPVLGEKFGAADPACLALRPPGPEIRSQEVLKCQVAGLSWVLQ